MTRIVATYDYLDASGHLLYQAVRKEPKSFTQRRPDGRGGWIYKLDGVARVLYRLPQLLAADKSAWVFVVEGEKDVDKLWHLGLVATTNAQGAGKWQPDYNQWLAGRRVCVLADNDAPGHKHAQQVAESLNGIAAQVKIVELPHLPPKGDVSDWLQMGGTVDELLTLAETAPLFVPTPTPKPAKTHTAKPVEFQDNNCNTDLVAQVKAAWSTFKVFEHHGFVKNGIEEEHGGSVRVLGHGGLIIQRNSLWYNHSEQVGGDQIDAWAHCTRRDRDRYFIEIIEEMANAAGIDVPRRFREPEPAPLPEGAQVRDSGHIILKTTPAPEPKPPRKVPVLTPSVVAKLAEALRGPTATKLINRLGQVRDKEGWRDFLIQLVTKIAPSQGKWVIDAGQDWLGEQFGISGVAVRKKMYTMDSAGLIRYLHTGKVNGGKTGRSVMRVDLQPMIADLWESCAKLENKINLDKEFSNFRNDPPTNVHAAYSGTGKFADASMRTLYKFAVARMGCPTVLARSVTKSALTALDYLARHGDSTRAELVSEVGMSAGSAAGGTRVLEQLGLVSVEWEGPGTPKVYVLRPDWEAHLQATIPHMVSYGARIRLVIRNYDRWIGAIERQLETTYSPQMRQQLSEHKKQLEGARKKWCDYGSKIGAYGRYVEINPPW